MADFNPDEFLEHYGKPNPVAKTQGVPPGEFNPDEFIEHYGKPPEPTPERPWYSVTPKGLAQGALNTLPAAGGLIGGAIGAFGGPGGMIGGAGLGSANGEAIRQGMAQQLGLEESPGLIKNIGNIAKEGTLGAGGELGAQALSKGISKAVASDTGKKVVGLVGKKLANVGEAFTGVPEKEIRTYANNANEIKAMAKASDNNTFEAAEQIRSKFGKDIDKTRAAMNEQISSTLNGSPKAVDSKPILEALEKSKTNIDPDLYPDQIKQIEGLKEKVLKLANKKGYIPIDRAHNLKSFFQDEASAAYRSPGQASLGTQSAKSAKSGAAVTRGLVNEAEPAVAKANTKLATLHDIEDSMNTNIIREGKPEAGLIAAGSGGNPRNAAALKDMGAATGTDMLGSAENLAAMRTFGSPKLMANDTTGKAAGRMGLAGGLGFLVGHGPGAVVAMGLTSPAAVKTAIDAGRLTKEMLSNPEVQSVLGQALARKAQKYLDERKGK